MHMEETERVMDGDADQQTWEWWGVGGGNEGHGRDVYKAWIRVGY